MLINFSELTKKEKQILDLLAHGLTIQQISKQCCICKTTTKTHIENIYQKFGVYNGVRNLVAEKRLRITLLYLQHIGKLSSDWDINFEEK